MAQSQRALFETVLNKIFRSMCHREYYKETNFASCLRGCKFGAFATHIPLFCFHDRKTSLRNSSCIIYLIMCLLHSQTTRSNDSVKRPRFRSQRQCKEMKSKITYVISTFLLSNILL